MKKGFTLVELSIVLVIIGLLIGGILAAQSMISTAKINAQVKQIQQVQIAVTNFKTTYNSLPGDTALFSGGSQPTKVFAGDNNGRIQGFPLNTFNATDSNYRGWTDYDVTQGGGGRSEYMSVFDALAATGFYKFAQYDESDVTAINTAGIANPLMAFQSSGITEPCPFSNCGDDGGKFGMLVVGWEPAGGIDGGYDSSFIKEGHKIKLGYCTHNHWANAPTAFYCGLSPAETMAVDKKLDDGLALSGDAGRS